jgi:RND superfamily putative drug exporter
MRRGTRPPLPLAARAGRWSARHRRTAIFGWLLFVVLATVLGGAVGQRNVPQAEMGSGESRRGDMIVDAAGFPEQTREQILVQGKGRVTAQGPEVTAAVEDLVGRLERIEGVSRIRSSLDPSERAGTVSRDGRSVVVNFSLPGEPDENEQRVGAPLAAVAAVQAAHPAVRVAEFGDASLAKGIAKADEDSRRKSELFSFPATLVILLVAFGALVAAGVPLLLGATAVMAAVGLLGPVSQLYALTPMVSLIVGLIGLAVGVDYALFYLRREMEERDNGRSPAAALDIAAATSGRAVLISGLTVMLAMAGMLVAGNALFASFAVGTILVVAVAVLGSLTFLPAMLSFLSAKGWTEKGRVPYVGRRRHANHGESWVVNAILDRVLARPLASAVLAAGVLVALTVPALGLQLKQAGTDGYSRSVPAIQTYDRLQAAFPGGAVPAVTVIKATDVTTPRVQGAIRRLRDEAIATGRLMEPSQVEISPDRTVATVALAVQGSGTDAASERAVEVLREEIVPATVGKLAGADVAVTGVTAGAKDFVDVMQARLPLVFAFVLSLAFVLLLVTFRSIVVPIKAIVLNLLSVGAAYGVLVLVFQDGHGERLLGFRSVGGIASGLPLFLFVILFGLSMDYHVFILSRVREAVNRGMSSEAAISHGIRSTAGVVTSAAAVMVAVFAAFTLNPNQEAKQLGVGLAVAILIDATIVRAVLLPASMKLLGRHNWYLPTRLSWLPRLEHEPEPQPAA